MKKTKPTNAESLSKGGSKKASQGSFTITAFFNAIPRPPPTPVHDAVTAQAAANERGEDINSNVRHIHIYIDR